MISSGICQLMVCSGICQLMVCSGILCRRSATMRPDPEPGQPARIRSRARVISSGIRQLMVCSRILCRIRNAGSSDQDTDSGSSCGGILCRRSEARTASTGSGCHFLRLQARKQAVRAAGRINSQANGHRQPEQAESGRI